ncbi:MAG: response regulator [Alcaligenaceae bacterium]
MSIQFSTTVTNIDDTYHLRRKLVTFFAAISHDSHTTALIISEFSEQAKLYITQNQHFEFRLLLEDNHIPFNLNICYQALLPLPSARNPLITQDKTVSLKAHLPSTHELEAILKMRSRSELFENINEQNRLLTVASEDALKSAQVKTDFMSNMSHEIRTPINAIMGMTHLLKMTEVTEQQALYLSRIEQSSEHLLGIINDILDFSKIESGKMELDRTSFLLSDLLINVFNNVSQKCVDKNLELICDVTTEHVDELNGDFLRISQVLINFISNAVKFTEVGEITLRISEQDRHNDDITLRFEVIDTGVGIAHENQEKLFQSFQQADSSTTRQYGGTGLGLSISKSLTNLMGGEVGFSSCLGIGSNFWFTAPLRLGTQANATSSTGDVFKGVQVIVVDDNEFAPKVLIEQLTRLGFDARTFHSGLAALNFLKQADRTKTKIEIIFIDAIMPDTTVHAFVKKVEQLSLAHTPKLALLGAIGIATEAIAKAQNFDAILYKPVHRSNLVDTVSNLLLSSGAISSKKTREIGDGYRKARAALEGAQILLVEDNEINQEVALGLLAHTHATVEVAANGEIAVALANAKKWDLILMDINMPIMDGIEATKLIRKNTELNSIPIIALTANILEVDRKLYASAGMNDYLSKPIRPEDLYLMLLKWITPRLSTESNIGQETAALVVEGSLTQHSIPLPTLDHLNTTLGLQFTNGDSRLYRSILSQFHRQNIEFEKNIVQHLHNDEYAVAERLAHTLKATSGSIGAAAIASDAQLLETYIKEQANIEKILDALERLSFKLTPLLIGLQNHFPVEAVAQTKTIIDTSQVKGVCRKLFNLLVDSDIGATTFFGTHCGLLQSLFESDYLELEDHIKNYDFDSACTALKKACLNKNIDL